MTAPPAREPRRGIGRFWPLGLGFFVLLAVALVLRTESSAPEESPATARPLTPVTRAPVAPPIPFLAEPSRARASTITVADDGRPIMPHEPGEPVPVGPVHPHPITPAHVRIYRENNLLGALNGALDVEDAPGLRRLLEQYRREYPEDPHALAAGYALIADCLEQPSEALRERARRYYETETASTLRRYVRRHCLK